LVSPAIDSYRAPRLHETRLVPRQGPMLDVPAGSGGRREQRTFILRIPSDEEVLLTGRRHLSMPVPSAMAKLHLAGRSAWTERRLVCSYVVGVSSDPDNTTDTATGPWLTRSKVIEPESGLLTTTAVRSPRACAARGSRPGHPAALDSLVQRRNLRTEVEGLRAEMNRRSSNVGSDRQW